MPGEIDSYEHGKPDAVPGKAVIVMNIEDPGFQDFRDDATCLIRPQSLIGEKYVDCRPTLPRAPGHAAAAAAEEDPRRPAGRRRVPAAAREQRHQRRPRPDQRHPDAALRAALPADLQRTRRHPRRARLGHRRRRSSAPTPILRDADRVLEILHDQRDELAQLATNSEHVTSRRSPNSASTSPASSPTPAPPARRPPNAAPNWKPALSKFPQFLREFRTTMHNLKGFSDAATPVFANLDQATPALTEATRNLTPFTAASTVALKSLGNAGEASGPIFAAADPVVKKARDLARTRSQPDHRTWPSSSSAPKRPAASTTSST